MWCFTCLRYFKVNSTVFFYSSSNLIKNSSRESYNAITNWLSDVRTLASPNIVIVLCGNKKDLEDQRQVTFLEASRFAQDHGIE